MKRLSAFRLTLILMVLGVVGVSILFGVLAYQSYNKEDDLADQVDEVELNIARLEQISDIGSLEAELASLTAQLNDAQITHFPSYVDDNEMIDLIDESAATADVTIEYWATGGVSVQPIDGSASGYAVYHYRVEASGALSQIFTFLGEMEENTPYETMKLEDLGLTYSDGSDSWSIQFDILVYAQP